MRFFFLSGEGTHVNDVLCASKSSKANKQAFCTICYWQDELQSKKSKRHAEAGMYRLRYDRNGMAQGVMFEMSYAQTVQACKAELRTVFER